MLRLSNYTYFLFSIIFLAFFSCKLHREPDVKNELSSLKKTAEKIQNDFNLIKKRTQYLAVFTKQLYGKKDYYNKLYHDIKYEQSDNGTLVKP